MSESAALRVVGITKRFGATLALDRVTLEAARGTVLGLLGQNGAGKSTLIKVLAGVLAADAGQVEVAGQPLSGGVEAARRAGVSVIYQDLALFPNLSVAENIAGELESGWAYSTQRVGSRARESLARLGVHLPLEPLVGELSLGAQQLVAIARALARDASGHRLASSILVLDEPTASLAAEESERLLTLVAELARSGHTAIFVSHRLGEVRRIADRFVVLRDGAVTLDSVAAAASNEQLLAAMFGAGSAISSQPGALARPGSLEAPESGDTTAATAATASQPPLLRARGCSRRGEFANISLELRAGEVVLLAGLIGAGRSEFAQSIFGLRRLDSGNVEAAGRPLVPITPHTALARGLAYVPEDRLVEGLFPSLSVAENLMHAVLRRFTRWFWLRPDRKFATRQIAEFAIRTPSPRAPVAALSGGNQQKVLLAKWLAASPRILFVDEPTAGIDVATKREIHRRLRALAASGVAILAISSDLDEVLDLATRVVVLRRGEKVLDRPRALTTREAVATAMA